MTYAAGATVLTAFFPDRAAELDMLADNAGMARLWAGVHYRSDHEQGMALGRAVGRKVLDQLTAACIPMPDPCNLPGDCDPAPSPQDVEDAADAYATSCPCS